MALSTRVIQALPNAAIPDGMIPGPLGFPLRHRAFGNPDAAQVVIAIHGGLMTLECFAEQYAALARAGVYVIGMDLPFHGISLPPQPDLLPTPELWSDSLLAVRQFYGLLERPVTLLAWSFGGYIVRNTLLLRGQQGITGLVLVASLLDKELMMAHAVRERGEAWGKLVPIYAPGQPLEARLAAVGEFVDMLWYQAPPLERYYLTLGGALRSFLACARAWETILDSAAPGDTREMLQRVQCPVLIVQGENDQLVPPSYASELAAFLDPRLCTYRLYPQCGHTPFQEHPERFNQDLLAFLNVIEAT